MVGVRAGTGVGLPAGGRRVGLEDLLVPDHVHDAEPAQVSPGVAGLVRGHQPGEQLVHLGHVLGVVRADAPVPGPALLVLARAADAAVAHDAEARRVAVGVEDQARERAHPRLGDRVADLLADVGLVGLDGRGQRGGGRRRRRQGRGCTAQQDREDGHEGGEPPASSGAGRTALRVGAVHAFSKRLGQRSLQRSGAAPARLRLRGQKLAVPGQTTHTTRHRCAARPATRRRVVPAAPR